MRDKLGPPDAVLPVPNGNVEVWRISRHPLSGVTVRSFSKAAGPIIDVNKVEDFEYRVDHRRDDRVGMSVISSTVSHRTAFAAETSVHP